MYFLASAENMPGEFWYDCTPLLKLPLLAEQIGLALSQRATSGYRTSSYRAMMNNLKTGFVQYAADKGIAEALSIDDLDTTFFNDFIDRFLSKKEDGVYVYAPYTRMHKLGALRAVVTSMRELKQPLPQDSHIRDNPWERATRSEVRPKDRPERTRDEMVDFYAYCRKEVADTMTFVEGLIADERLAVESRSGTSMSDRLRAQAKKAYPVIDAKAYFGASLPERGDLKELHPRMYPSIQGYGYRKMTRNFGPYAADLCAFVYYLAHTTQLNLQPLVDIKAKNVRVERSTGRDIIRIATTKHRTKAKAGSESKRIEKSWPLDDDPLSPGNVIHFLYRWTQFLRENSNDESRKYLFCFIPRNRSDASRLDTYAMVKARGGRTEFERHTTFFCKDGGFRWTGLREIRGQMAELLDEQFEHDTSKVSAALDHSNIDTTRSHYQNDQVLSRHMRRFAHAAEQHQRWWISDGKVEPRNLPKDHDPSAATDGFVCLDPYDSPRDGQPQGRLCGAFGDCPACPFAMVDLTSARSAARCRELKKMLEDVRERTGERAFEARWGKNYRALKSLWIPSFSPEVTAKANDLLLPPLPSIE